MKKRGLTTLFSIATIAGLAAVVAPIAVSCSTQPTQQQDNNQNGNDNQIADKNITQEQIEALNIKTPQERIEYFRQYITNLKSGTESKWNKLIRNPEFGKQMLSFVFNAADFSSLTADELTKLKNETVKMLPFLAHVDSKPAPNGKDQFSFWTEPTSLKFEDKYEEIVQKNNSNYGTYSWLFTTDDNGKHDQAISGLGTFKFWVYLTSNVDLTFALDESGNVIAKVMFNNLTGQKSKLTLWSNEVFATATKKERNFIFKNNIQITLPLTLLSDLTTFLKKEVLPNLSNK